MKLTARLALSQLKVNKRRTIWTFTSIMLTSAMLATIYGLGFGSGMAWIDGMIPDGDLSVTFDAFIIGLAIVMSMFILSIAVIVISNAFRVSAGERSAQFGILKSVGATNKQIMQTVIYEGIYLTIIAVPAGLLLGMLAQFVSVSLINHLIEPLLSLEQQISGESLFQFVWSWLSVVTSVGVSVLTVFLSAWLPARKVAHIPAIKIIRGMGEVQIKNKKVRGGKVVQKAFGFEGTLARKFLKRSKRNFRATVIALSFSIAIFIVAGGFLEQMNDFKELQWSNIDANVSLSVGFESDREVDCEEITEGKGYSTSSYEDGAWVETCFIPGDVAELEKSMDEFRALHESLRGVLNEGDKLVGLGRTYSLGHSRTRYQTQLPMSALADEMTMILQEGDSFQGEEFYEFEVELIVVDDAFAKQLANMAGVEVGSNILINQGISTLQDGRLMEHEIIDFTGQTLTVSTADEASTIEVELHGQMTPEQMPAELGNGWFRQLRVIVPEAAMMGMSWWIQTEDSAAVAEESKALLLEWLDGSDSYVRVDDLELMEAIEGNIRGLVTLFVFAFVGMLIAIGLTNVVSTISENVKARAKEFAVLQSVGMTSGGIKRMLGLESVFSSLKALLIGVPLGILGSYGTFRTVGTLGKFSFKIPWLWVVSSIVGVFLITWLTMRYAANSLKGRNMIETIRSGSGM